MGGAPRPKKNARAGGRGPGGWGGGGGSPRGVGPAGGVGGARRPKKAAGRDAGRPGQGSQAPSLELHFLVLHMLALLGVKARDGHFLRHGFLVFGRGVEVAGSCRRFQLDFVASAFACHGASPWVLQAWPRARRSTSTASMPFLSIRRSAALDTRSRTQRFSVSTQKRRYCRFGRNRRRVLLLAWETLFPTMGFLPVTSHTRAMRTLRYFFQRPLAGVCRHLRAPVHAFGTDSRQSMGQRAASPRQKGGGNPICQICPTAPMDSGLRNGGCTAFAMAGPIQQSRRL